VLRHTGLEHLDLVKEAVTPVAEDPLPGDLLGMAVRPGAERHHPPLPEDQFRSEKAGPQSWTTGIQWRRLPDRPPRRLQCCACGAAFSSQNHDGPADGVGFDSNCEKRSDSGFSFALDAHDFRS